MRRSLKATLAWVTIGVAVAGLVALVAIVAITSALHVGARDLATESVRVAEQVEVQLVLNYEISSPMAKGATRAALLRSLDESETFVQSSEERRRVAELRQAVEAYLRSDGGGAEVGAALSAAHRLSLLNVEQARQTRSRAEMLDHLAEIGAVLAALLLMGAVVGFLVWLRRGPFRHVADLSSAMEKFSAGDLDARAPEVGPQELVIMARSFNGAAGALVRARQQQAEYVTTVVHDLRIPL